MNFDKPKVTIDLEEYQHLKDRVNGMNADEYVVAAKKVLAAFISSRFDINNARDRLKKENILFAVINRSVINCGSRTIDDVMPDDISISIIKP